MFKYIYYVIWHSIYLKIKGCGFNWSHLCTGAVCCCCFFQEKLDRAAHVVIATIVEQGVLCCLRSWLEKRTSSLYF